MLYIHKKVGEKYGLYTGHKSNHFQKIRKKIDSNAKTKRFQNRQSREKEEHENESKKNKFA